MSNTKPLYTLTVEEYIDLNKKIFSEEADRIINIKLDQLKFNKSDDDVIFIDEAVELTGYKKSSIYSKVCKFEIPVLSRLRPLTFSKKALLQWITDGKPNVISLNAKAYSK